MLRFDPHSSIRPTSDARGFFDYVTGKEIFQRSVDVYAFAAAFAIIEKLDFSDPSLNERKELVGVNALDEEVRITLGVALTSVDEPLQKNPDPDSSDLMAAFVRAAEVGCRSLETRWKRYSRSQIAHDVKATITE